MNVVMLAKQNLKQPQLAFRQRAERAATLAADFATEVDALGRFPAEAISAMRAERLLGMMVPVSLGGDGASVANAASAGR